MVAPPDADKNPKVFKLNLAGALASASYMQERLKKSKRQNLLQ
jgi:hypothetical protein